MTGVGFAMGLERLLLVLESLDLIPENLERPDIFIANVGDQADLFVQKLVYGLRNAGISAERDYLSRSVKAQMKYANKTGAQFSAVIGDDDIAAKSASVKNMQTGETDNVPFDHLAEFIKTNTMTR